MSREGFSPKPRVFVSYPRDDGEEFATNLRKRYYLKSDREPKRAAFMALDSCGTLRVWDLESGQTLRTLQCHTDSVTAVALTPDTCRVVSGSHGNTLRVWDLEDVKEFVTFTVDRIVTACAVARDNRLIVAGDRFGQLHFLRLKEAVQTKPAPDDIKIQLLRRQQPTVKAEKPRGPFLPMLPAQTRAVFISYAHTDNQSPDPQKRWLDRFVEFLKPLVRQENATLCSDQDIKIGEEWHEHLQAHLNGAKAAVLLVSPAFLASNYIADSELPIIWRNAVDHGVRIFPILISPSLFERAKYKYPDPKTGPQEFTLSSLQAANPPSKTLVEMTEGEQNRVLLEVADQLAQLLSANPKVDPSREAAPDAAGYKVALNGPDRNLFFTARHLVARPGPEKISLANLPVTGRDVFGREEDIAFLDRAWANKDINVVTIVAWAGVGKSTLVNHWLRRVAADHYRSAELVFGWSFYRQGSSGETSSADEFLEAALHWFGDPDPRLGTTWEKGERLAKLVAHRRTLLVLDGLEPLQNPPGPQEGRVREPSLQALLCELAAFNSGLCVITTRLPIADIADHERTSALRRDLEHLPSDAGAQLLRALGVKGDEAELRSTSDEFSGHCLALTLLGSYLTDAYHGDIRCRSEVSGHLAQDVQQGIHARKVMESYQTWFGESPELSVLRMLGLFDRPAVEKALGALLKSPAIPGLTESLTNLSPTHWRTVLAKL